MFNKPTGTSKVNFLDEHIDNILTENAALRSKLQSKVEALCIMRKQLEKCCMEKEGYRLLGEQLQARRLSASACCSALPCSPGPTTTSTSAATLLASTREHNKMLSIQVETLKNRLEEADEDIRVLRKQDSPVRKMEKKSVSSSISALTFEREELVRELEKSNKKSEQLQADLRSMLDEKEDLINERDAYKCKLHRLNHQLTVALTRRAHTPGKPPPRLDIDSLIMENRYLQERLTQSQAELQLATQALTKYKGILESKHRKAGSLKLGCNTSNSIVTHKQVKQLLESGTTQEFPITAATISDLRALSFGLLDALNDKSLALSHQRKANRILASRITDLEKKLEGNDETSLFPSKVFLESYISSEVDNFDVNITELTTNDGEDLQRDSTTEKSTANPEAVEGDQTNGEVYGSKSIASSPHTHGASSQTALGCEEEEDVLPPELEKLVQEALQTMNLENQ